MVWFGQRTPFSVPVGRALSGLGGIVTDASWRCNNTLRPLAAFDFFGILLVYSGEALLVGGLIGMDCMT